jgi:hypothetical protein
MSSALEIISEVFEMSLNVSSLQWERQWMCRSSALNDCFSNLASNAIAAAPSKEEPGEINKSILVSWSGKKFVYNVSKRGNHKCLTVYDLKLEGDIQGWFF